MDFIAEGAQRVFIEKQKLVLREAHRAARAVQVAATRVSQMRRQSDSVTANRPSLPLRSPSLLAPKPPVWERLYKWTLKAAGVRDADAKFFWNMVHSTYPFLIIILLCVALGELENYTYECNSCFSSNHKAGQAPSASLTHAG